MSIYIFFNTGSPLLNLKFKLGIAPEPSAFGEKYFAGLLRGCTDSFWLNIKKIVQDLILNLLFNILENERKVSARKPVNFMFQVQNELMGVLHYMYNREQGEGNHTQMTHSTCHYLRVKFEPTILQGVWFPCSILMARH